MLKKVIKPHGDYVLACFCVASRKPAWLPHLWALYIFVIKARVSKKDRLLVP